MVCINARNLKSIYSHRLKILPGDLASYQLSSLPQQVLRASVLLAFPSFPSVLWNCERLPLLASAWEWKQSQVQASWSLVLFCISSWLQLSPNHSLRLQARGTSHSLSQTGFPREGNIFLCCLWRHPQSSSNFPPSTVDFISICCQPQGHVSLLWALAALLAKLHKSHSCLAWVTFLFLQFVVSFQLVSS